MLLSFKCLSTLVGKSNKFIFLQKVIHVNGTVILLHTLAHLICCIILIYGSILHSLDHVHAEPESEDRSDQAAVEDPANTELTSGKP
jgi:hypothetical protein